MRNIDSTSGIGEDMIRNIMNLSATEMHLKTLFEKTLAEMENGIVDLDDPDALNEHIEKADNYRQQMIEVADIRRKTMRSLFDLFDGDKDAWCLVKHLAVSSETAWETYLASDDDPGLLELSVATNKAFIKALTQFLGMEITSCASCLSDYLRSDKGENKDGTDNEEL